MRRGIPNRPRSGKAWRGCPEQRLARGPRSTDFATMNKPEWRISDGAVSYAEALAVREERVADIRAGDVLGILPGIAGGATNRTLASLSGPSSL